MILPVSARGVYLWIKYLKNITFYDDENGWTLENEGMGKYTYRKILKKMHNEYNGNFGDGTKIFEELKHSSDFSIIFKRKKITMVDQLDWYAREAANKW